MTSDVVAGYRRTIDHPVLRAAWQNAYGEQFWPDCEAPWSMSTIDDVQFVCAALGLREGMTVADLGCGPGSFGRTAARDFGAAVWGVDLNPAAVAAARARAEAAGVSHLTTYCTGDASDTSKPASSFDGVVSLDVWMFVPDKQGFADEAARLLKPRASFAGTVWEFRRDSASLSLPAFTAYESCLAAAGFDIVAYEETADWRALLTHSMKGVVAAEAELRRDLDADVCERLFKWAKTRVGELDDSRRVRFHARKAS
jgi:2-polyprenyl-3-methyl-5-hydroxy-6-metoxy-1,4-benzoquinol methylase